jgi:microcystin-dependent protein
VGVDDRLNGIGQLENPEFAPLPPTNPNDLKTPGRVGGSKTHKLTQAELPNYDLKRGVAIETPSGGNEVIWSSAPGGSHQQIINSGGGDQPHTILNPYRTVLFIEYIG